MALNVQLSLESLSEIKVVTTLHEKVIRKGKLTEVLRVLYEMPHLKNFVAVAIDSLPLPRSCKRRLSAVAIAIHEEIFQLVMNMKVLFNNQPILIAAFNNAAFTSLGCVDYKKTVKGMLRDPFLSIYDKFLLACEYCLENEIKDLRQRHSEANLLSPHSAGLVFRCWCDNFERHESEEAFRWDDVSLCRNGFFAAIESRNGVAVAYFLQKLPHSQRESDIEEGLKILDCMTRCACNRYDVEGRNVQLHLLLNSKNRDEYCDDLLKCLWVWPYQSIYPKYLEHYRNSLSEHLFKRAFYHFGHTIVESRTDYDYAYLLKKTVDTYFETTKKDLSHLIPKHLWEYIIPLIR